ncbi:MAG: L-histidine N(alpha)-methyltransferase [Gemmatimonadaceae bacterium]
MSTVTFRVDRSMFEPPHALPNDVYGRLDEVVRPDLRYHYSTPICAHRWMTVCDDPAYGHQALLERLAAQLPALIAALREDRADGGALSVVSLGPGDGALDHLLLRGLDAAMDLEEYLGLDFSFELLRRSTQRLAQANGWRRPFPLHAICGDFRDLDAEALADRPARGARLFLLTGFTLGNYGESSLLARCRGLMRAGDYLLLDARLHSLGAWPAGRQLTAEEQAATVDGYDIPSVRRFVFGPVEVATYATADDVRFRFDVSRALTTVPNAVNVVISCQGLDTTMRLTGERVHRDHLDLAVTTRYHAPDLHEWMGTAGFATVWQRDVTGVAFYLLRRD